MALIHQAGVRHVDAQPTPRGDVDADVGPCVAGRLGRIGVAQVAADIPRRNTLAAARGDEYMGLVLAHAAAGVERFLRGRLDIGVARSIFDLAQNRVREFEQAGRIDAGAR